MVDVVGVNGMGLPRTISIRRVAAQGEDFPVS